MIGIFGGTFDPVHFGHLRPALELKESLALTELRLVPSRVPPHRGMPVATAEQRLAMLQLAVADQPDFTVDTRELDRSGPSYMVDTLRSLRAEVGEVPLCLLLGADAFLGLPNWHCWEAVTDLAHIVVAHRPGWSLDAVCDRADQGVVCLLRDRWHANISALRARAGGGLWLQPVTSLDISATAIRRLVATGRSPRYLLPDPVWHYIEEQGLYRQ